MGQRVLGIGLTGTALNDLERRILSETPPYSVVLFARNIESTEQLREYVAEIKSIARPSPLVLIDQEGGRVDRLRNLIPGIPGAEASGRLPDAERVIRRLGTLMGRALRYFDIDVNLAPVVDIERERPVRGLESRCYGRTPEQVVALAGALMRGHHDAGTATCLKHFPGLGRGHGDTHYGISRIDARREELETIDLAPYRRLADEAGAVMIGHGTYPALEAPDVPATLSHAIATDLLRGEIGFKGVAFSDDMEMHAVSDLGTFESNKERALMAGNDVVLFCSQVERMPELIAEIGARVRRDSAFAARFEEAAARAETYRRHARDLRERAKVPTGSFEEIREAFSRFCDEYEAICDRTGSSPGGTGRTGREEWT